MQLLLSNLGLNLIDEACNMPSLFCKQIFIFKQILIFIIILLSCLSFHSLKSP